MTMYVLVLMLTSGGTHVIPGFSTESHCEWAHARATVIYEQYTGNSVNGHECVLIKDYEQHLD